MIKAKNKKKEVIRMKWRKTGIYLLMSVFLLTGCADAGSEEEKTSNVTELMWQNFIRTAVCSM